MKYLLDTHILLWWFIDNSRQTASHRKMIDSETRKGNPLGISIMTFWEIAKLVESGKLAVSFSLDTWFEELEEMPELQILPLSSRIILESTRLSPKFHKDPADQIIAATSRVNSLILLTRDERIIKSGLVAIG
jgi:PIN domain nuclease of toxin-antitoxin system